MPDDARLAATEQRIPALRPCALAQEPSTPDGGAMIQLDALSMHYDTGSARVEVLKDLELQVRAGEHVAVSGPSGSGKTTLLLLLAGL